MPCRRTGDDPGDRRIESAPNPPAPSSPPPEAGPTPRHRRHRASPVPSHTMRDRRRRVKNTSRPVIRHIASRRRPTPGGKQALRISLCGVKGPERAHEDRAHRRLPQGLTERRDRVASGWMTSAKDASSSRRRTGLRCRQLHGGRDRRGFRYARSATTARNDPRGAKRLQCSRARGQDRPPVARHPLRRPRGRIASTQSGTERIQSPLHSSRLSHDQPGLETNLLGRFTPVSHHSVEKEIQRASTELLVILCDGGQRRTGVATERVVVMARDP